MTWLSQAAWTLAETVRDVIPIAAVIIGFQVLVLRKPVHNFKRIATGFVYVLLGLTLFLLGLEQALFPLGRVMAEQLTDPGFLADAGWSLFAGSRWDDYYWVYVFAFAIGFSTTIAEPSLIAVAIKANDVSAGAIGVGALRVAVALGVAFGIAVGTYRIVVGDPIHYYIIAGYLVVVIQTGFAPRSIIPLAYDTGGVTTSTVTVPLVAALGLGLAETVPGRNPVIDGFGLIAFASLFPIISVLAYAQLAEWREQRNLQRTPEEGSAPKHRHRPDDNNPVAPGS